MAPQSAADLAASQTSGAPQAIMQSAGARVQWKDEDGIDPCTATDEANEALVIQVDGCGGWMRWMDG